MSQAAEAVWAIILDTEFTHASLFPHDLRRRPDAQKAKNARKRFSMLGNLSSMRGRLWPIFTIR
jgi:hypothetical protein